MLNVLKINILKPYTFSLHFSFLTKKSVRLISARYPLHFYFCSLVLPYTQSVRIMLFKIKYLQ